MIENIIGSLLAGCAGFALFFYYWRKGQFDDVEDVKYQLFRDEEK